jgi:hypothetical protein
VAVTGLTGILRALKTPLMERCVRMERGGSTPLEITDVYRSGYRAGMLEGNVIEGTFIFGCGAGLIKEIKGAAEVVREVVKDAQKILA